MTGSAIQMQIETLVELGYPVILGMSVSEFRDVLAALDEHLSPALDDVVDLERGRVPFVIVIKSERAPVGTMLPLVKRDGEAAFEKLYPIEPERFVPIESVKLPQGIAYMLIDIDRGQDLANVTPNDALGAIRRADRSPLTIEEGIALLTHFPDLLRKNQCFSLLGSRCGDQRVPALWLSDGRPKLGWCWAGNPHTWLGSASCGRRAGLSFLNSSLTGVDFADAHSS